MFASLISLALAIGATFSTGPADVPTSLCYDPLLGPSMIIYTDCSDGAQVPAKGKHTDQAATVQQETPAQVTIQAEQPAQQPKVEQPKPEQPAKDKQKCNKGSGNGAEGCDPGNHPENGNNDEGGDRKPENSKH